MNRTARETQSWITRITQIAVQAAKPLFAIGSQKSKIKKVTKRLPEFTDSEKAYALRLSQTPGAQSHTTRRVGYLIRQ